MRLSKTWRGPVHTSQIAGTPAKAQMVRNRANTIVNFKYLLGKRYGAGMRAAGGPVCDVDSVVLLQLCPAGL